MKSFRISEKSKLADDKLSENEVKDLFHILEERVEGFSSTLCKLQLK